MKILKHTYLTRRFFLGMLLGAFAFVMAYVFPWLFPVVTILVVCWLGFVFWEGFLLYHPQEGMEVVRIVADKLSNGEENPVVLTLRNRYPLRVKIRVIDEIPVEFQKRDVCFLGKLAWGEQREMTYTLHPVRRGVYVFGKIRVFVSCRYAFIERRYSFDADREVAVYPSFMMMRRTELAVLGNAQASRDAVRVRAMGGLAAFEQIKPYVAGDDPRAVNWKATAKMNRLMVNTYREERAQQIYCVLDMGRTMYSPFDGMTMLDHAVNAILSLSNVILKKEDRVGLITFSNDCQECLRADNRPGQLQRMSEILYRLESHYLETDFDRLYALTLRQVPTRGLFILFSNFDTVSGLQRHLATLQRLAKRQLLLVVLFENSELVRGLEQPVMSVREAYFETVATGFALEKRQMVHELSRLGIHVVLSRPEALTLSAINGYLALKRQKLI